VTVHVRGLCHDVGLELTALARRVVVADDARFRLGDLERGLIPGAGGTATLPRRIGRQLTAWLALSGETVDARTALAWGLVDVGPVDASAPVLAAAGAR
jgi:enoyl-CoA hydratase/carnithine racemase